MGKGRAEPDPEPLQRDHAFTPFPSAFWEADAELPALAWRSREALGAGLAPRVCPDFHPSAELGTSHSEVWRWIELPMCSTEKSPSPSHHRDSDSPQVYDLLP